MVILSNLELLGKYRLLDSQKWVKNYSSLWMYSSEYSIADKLVENSKRVLHKQHKRDIKKLRNFMKTKTTINVITEPVDVGKKPGKAARYNRISPENKCCWTAG